MRSKLDYSQEELRFYTSSEAAKKLGLSEQTINRMCEKGRFIGAKRTDDINGEWVIPQENFITTNEQDDVAEMVLQKIDNNVNYHIIASETGRFFSNSFGIFLYSSEIIC